MRRAARRAHRPSAHPSPGTSRSASGRGWRAPWRPAGRAIPPAGRRPAGGTPPPGCANSHTGRRFPARRGGCPGDAAGGDLGFQLAVQGVGQCLLRDRGAPLFWPFCLKCCLLLTHMSTNAHPLCAQAPASVFQAGPDHAIREIRDQPERPDSPWPIPPPPLLEMSRISKTFGRPVAERAGVVRLPR